MSDPGLKALLAIYDKFREAYHKRYPGRSENDSENAFIAHVGVNIEKLNRASGVR